MSKKKIIILISTIIVVVATIVGVTLGLTLGDKSYRNIKAYYTEGVVEVNRNGKALECYNEMSLKSGDLIESKDNSILIMRLDSDKFIKLNENSKIELICSEKDSSKTTIRLLEGSSLIEIKNKLLDDEFVVEAPNSSMAIRGTVLYVSAFKTNDGFSVSYSLAEGSGDISTYNSSSECKSAPMKAGTSLNIAIPKASLLLGSEISKIREAISNNDSNVKAKDYENLTELIKEEMKLDLKGKEIAPDDKNDIYDGLDYFKTLDYGLITSGATFDIIDSNIKNQISYEGDKPFRAIIRPLVPDGMVLSHYKLNDKIIERSDTPLIIDVNSKLKLEAIYERIVISYDIEIIGGSADGKTSLKLAEGAKFTIKANNPNNYIITGIKINDKFTEGSDSEYTIEATENMKIEFIYDDKTARVQVINGYIDGYMGKDIVMLKPNSEIIIRPNDKRPLKSYIITDSNGSKEYEAKSDEVKLNCKENLKVELISYECNEDETIVFLKNLKLPDKDFSSYIFVKRNTSITLSLIDNKYKLDYYLVNNRKIADKSTPLTIMVEDRMSIEAVVVENDKFNINVIGGNVGGKQSLSLYEGSSFKVEADNLEGLNILAILINGKPVENIASELELTLNSNMEIEFIYDKDNRNVTLENAYIEGYEGKSVVTLPLNSKVTIRSIDKRPIKAYTINGESFDSEYDFFSTVVDKNLTISVINLDCDINKTRFRGFNINVIGEGLVTDGLIDRGSRIVIEPKMDNTKLLSHYLVNGEKLLGNKNVISLEINESTSVEAVLINKEQFKVSVTNGFISSLDNSPSEGSFYSGEYFSITPTNNENKNIIGLNINGKIIENIIPDMVLEATEDMSISYIMDSSPITATVYRSVGGSVSVNGTALSDEFIKLEVENGKNITIEAKANNGYRFEGYYTREYSGSNRQLIFGGSNLSYTMHHNLSFYPSFAKIEEYKVMDSEGEVDIKMGMNNLLPYDMPDVDFNRFKLYKRDLKTGEFILEDEASYIIKCFYSDIEDIFSANDITREISINEMSTIKPGAYMMQYLSLSSKDNGNLDPLARINLIVSKEIVKPDKLASISFNGEAIDIVPSRSFGYYTNALGEGALAVDYDIKSLRMTTIKQEQMEMIAVNTKAIKDLVRLEEDGSISLNGFDYQVADGYSLYTMDPVSGEAVPYTSGSRLPLMENMFLGLVIANNKINQATLLDDPHILIDGCVLIFAFTELSGIISVGHNKLIDEFSYQSPRIRNIAVAEEGINTIPPQKNDSGDTITPGIIEIDINTLCDDFKLDYSYLNPDGSIDLRLDSNEITITKPLNEGMAKPNANGIYEFNLMPSSKKLISDVANGFSYDYNVRVGFLRYELECNIKGEDFIVVLNHYILPPEAKRIRYDYLYNINPMLALDLTAESESFGYIKTVFDRYFVEGGDGYDLKEAIEIMPPVM